jgi:hypothetical protein
MKKVLAVLAMVLGATIALLGLAGTPLVQDHLPVEFELPANGLAAQHQYFRIVPAEPQGPEFLPYLLMLSGITTLAIGIVFRRKLRSTAA